MTALELLCWLGVVWCFAWGVFGTVRLFRMRKQRRPPPVSHQLLAGSLVVMQAIGMGLFLSSALWINTARELGLAQ